MLACSGTHSRDEKEHRVPQSTPALHPAAKPTPLKAMHPTGMCSMSRWGTEIGSSAVDTKACHGHHDAASIPYCPKHLLPGAKTVPERLEVHVWVGHDPSIEVDKVQPLKPAWGRAQQRVAGRGVGRGRRHWDSMQADGGLVGQWTEIQYLQRSSWATRRTDARLPRSTSTVET